MDAHSAELSGPRSPRRVKVSVVCIQTDAWGGGGGGPSAVPGRDRPASPGRSLKRKGASSKRRSGTLTRPRKPRAREPRTWVTDVVGTRLLRPPVGASPFGKSMLPRKGPVPRATDECV